MSLDLGSGLTSTRGSGDSVGTPTRQSTPRVIAVVHARSAEHLVAALAGLAAQSRQPDLLVAVDALPTHISVHPHEADQPSGPAPLSPAADVLEPPTDEPAIDEPPTDEPAVNDLRVDDADEPAAVRTGGVDALAASFGGLTDTDQSLAMAAVRDSAEHPPVAPASDDLPTGAHDMTGLLHDADGHPVLDQGNTQLLATTEPQRAPNPRAVLAAHCDAVLTMPVGTTTNAAVAAALAWADEHPEEHESASTTQDWIWLLGDHDRPSMKALEHLIDSVKLSPNVAVVGAKHRAGPTGRDLVDVGVTTTRWGRILTMVEPGEPDQGQRDHVADTLAVPLSGMLVRRDVWTKLQGLDPALQQLTTLDAAVDFCRRVWLTGHRVEAQPTAVLTSANSAPPAISRRARTHRRLAAAPLLLAPVVALTVALGAVLRVLVGVVAKEPFRALHHAGASLVPLLRPDQVLRARWRAWRTHQVPRRRLGPLYASTRTTWRWQRERWQRSRPRLVSPAGRDAAAVALWKPALLVLSLAVAGVVALLRIARPGPFTSDAMPAITPDLSALWGAGTASWVPADLGHPGPVDPIVAVVAALGAPVGSPRLAILIVLLLALPLAGWAAWWATGGLTRRPAIRALCTLAWAGSPVLLLAVSQARVPIVLAAIFLPLAVRALGQSIAASTQRSGWAWAAAGGLLLVPATAGLPALALALVAVTLLMSARTRRLAIALAAMPTLVVSLPVLLAAIDHPALLFSEAGTPLAQVAPPAWAPLLGWPVPADTLMSADVAAWLHRTFDALLGADVVAIVITVVPWVLGSGAAVLALLGVRMLLRGSPRGAVARTGWVLAALGVVMATVSGWFTVASNPTGSVNGSASAGTLLAVFGLVVAGSAGWGAAGERRTGVMAAIGRGVRRLGGVLLGTLTMITIVAWAAMQLLTPAASDVRAGANPPLPASVIDAATSPDAVRTVTITALAAQQGDLPNLEVSVLRGDGPGLATQSSAVTASDTGADPADEALAEAVVRTVRGDADARELLAPFGVGAIVLLPSNDDAADGAAQVATRLDSTLGLGPAGQTAGVRAWRVNSVSGQASAADRPAAVRIVPAERAAGPAWTAVPSRAGEVDVTVTATPGTLVLAERFDPGWHATLDGRPLTPVKVDGWAQGFEIGSGTGRLVVDHQTTWHRVIGWIQILVLLTALVIALPVRTRDTRTSETARSQGRTQA